MTNPADTRGAPTSTLDDEDPFALDDRVQATDVRPVKQAYPTRSSQDEVS
jgi:hypothetical protein